MLLYNTGSWLAGDFIPEGQGQHAVIQHWILIGKRVYNRSTDSEWCYVSLDSDQQTTLYQKNRASMLLYNTGCWSASDFILEEPSQHDAIKHRILISRPIYIRTNRPACCCSTLDLDQQTTFTRRTGSACCYITLDPDQWATLYKMNRVIVLVYKIGSGSAGDFIREELDQHVVI